MPKYRYKKREHQAYVVYTDRLLSNPIRVTLWWPIGHVFKSDYMTIPLEDLDGEFDLEDLGAGSQGMFRSPNGWIVTLKDGGKTLPDFRDEVVIEPPKTKRTRYHDGAWWIVKKSGKEVKGEKE